MILDSRQVVILDVRPADEYRGAERPHRRRAERAVRDHRAAAAGAAAVSEPDRARVRRNDDADGAVAARLLIARRLPERGPRRRRPARAGLNTGIALLTRSDHETSPRLVLRRSSSAPPPLTPSAVDPLRAAQTYAGEGAATLPRRRRSRSSRCDGAVRTSARYAVTSAPPTSTAARRSTCSTRRRRSRSLIGTVIPLAARRAPGRRARSPRRRRELLKKQITATVAPFPLPDGLQGRLDHPRRRRTARSRTTASSTRPSTS